MARNSNYKGRSNRRGKQNGSRTQGARTQGGSSKPTESRATRLTDYVGSTNDISWYNRNPQLISDAAKIPFSYQLGRPVDLGMGSATYNIGSKDVVFHTGEAIPGIMSLQMLCTPGLAVDASDGVNIATSLTFQKMRKELSTYAAYAPADIMMYIMGIDSIYTQYAYIARLFGIVNAYSATNLYLPDALIEAGYNITGANIGDLKAGINDYRAKFNNLIYKASTLYMPVDFSITSRHAWLFMNYFIDNNSPKAQIYIHKLLGYHMLDETTSANGTCLMFQEYARSNSISHMLREFDACIESYRNSDSMTKIAADMRRAFGDSSTWKLSYIDENYIALPTEDRVVLTQIHNMTMYPSSMAQTLLNQYESVAEGGFNIYQDVAKNTVIFNPVWSTASATPTTAEKQAIVQAAPSTYDVMLDFNEPEVSTDMIVEGTRNVVVGEFVDNAGKTEYHLLSCGADLCVMMEIYQKIGLSIASQQYPGGVIADGITPSFTEQMATSAVSYIGMFNWAPAVWFGATDPTLEHLYRVGQLDNYTTAEAAVIARLNDNIMCSMWDVPALG